MLMLFVVGVLAIFALMIWAKAFYEHQLQARYKRSQQLRRERAMGSNGAKP